MTRENKSTQKFLSLRQIFLKFSKFHKKTPVLDSLFDKVAGLQACNFIKNTATQAFSCELKNTFLTEHLRRLAASEVFFKDFADINYDNA